MINKTRPIFIAITLFLLTGMGCTLIQVAAISVDSLTCEYESNPLGIDVRCPRLAWKIESDLRNVRQSAYHILVASHPDTLALDRGDLWDSGNVDSDRSIQIEYAGRRLRSGDRCYWKVCIRDREGHESGWSEPAVWEMGLLDPSDWQGVWISDGKPAPETDAEHYEVDPAPLFKKIFEVDKPVRQARLYAAGLGYYYVTVNGKSPEERFLSPTWTNFDKRIFYDAYDVTRLLKEADNAIGITLGNGWYNPLPLRMWGHKNLREHLPIGRPCFILQLNLEYEDGSRESIVSDPTWKFTEGPCLRNNIYLGELYDAQREIPGWDRAVLETDQWNHAAQTAGPSGNLQTTLLEPIRVTDSIRPVRISEPVEGVYIFDMGENFTGTVELRVKAPAGKQIQLRYGELLYEDGMLNVMTSVCGQIKGPNKNAPAQPDTAFQNDIYIAGGKGLESYIPKFTFHAFRYVEMRGYPGTPHKGTLTGLRLHTDLPEAGKFTCSNPVFNEIQEICVRTFKSNLIGVQSDCPHRERFGYGGDIAATSEAFIANLQMPAFYAKTVYDFADAARHDGMLTDTAPFVGIQYCGIGWALAHPLLIRNLVQYYGDIRLAEAQYPVAEKWFNLVKSKNPDHLIRSGLSDHESLRPTPAGPLVTPLYHQSAGLMKDLASVTGRDLESVRFALLAEKIRDAYNSTFFDADSNEFEPGTQTAQASALFLDLVPENRKEAVLAGLLEKLVGEDHLTTGILGTRFMLNTLSESGHANTAYGIVNRRGFPGWRNMLDQGATTLWEHWKFSDNTFSHNHPMFGSVSEWFFKWLGGIQLHEDAIGFDRIMLRPQFVDSLGWVDCSHETIRGTIKSRWARKRDMIDWFVTIPANAEAEIHFEDILPEQVTESGRPVSEIENLHIKKYQNGFIGNSGSGRYHFIISGKTNRYSQ